MRWPKTPAWSVLIASLGWLVAGVFFLAWAFNVGGGPFDPNSFGTAGEWVSGMGTLAAVGLSLYIALHERHQRHLKEESDKRRAAIKTKYRHHEQEFARTKEARELIPITIEIRLVDGSQIDDAGDGLYEVDLTVFNGSPRPLARFECHLRTSGDVPVDDLDNPDRPRNVWAMLAEGELVPPNERLRNTGMRFRLPVERVENGLYYTATWWTGDWKFDWSHFPRADGHTYVSASNPTEDERRRKEAAQEVAPTAE
jgi:hypothetical protein